MRRSTLVNYAIPHAATGAEHLCAGKRKAVLDALREELRGHNYLPVLFDFPETESRDLTETVSLLARMARFIIADLTNPSIPKELEAIVPALQYRFSR